MLITLDCMKELSIDQIVDMYKLGYRFEEGKILENKILGDPIVDPFVNFGKVSIPTGYTDLDTVITLSSGDGSNLPDPSVGAYNLVWWNSTDYSDPTDDPNKEIVRVTIKSGDVLTISRGQENTIPSVKNIPGKTYRMVNALTAKTIGDLQTYANTSVENHRSIGIHALGQIPQIHAGESHKGNIVVTPSSYNVTTSDDTILCNSSLGAISIYLPSVTARVGKIYNIKKTDSSTNFITVVAASPNTIEGSSTRTISNQWGFYTIQSDGVSNWIILSSTYGMVNIGTLGESVISYNSPPYSGITDKLNRSDSMIASNGSISSGFTDNLNKTEAISWTNSSVSSGFADNLNKSESVTWTN